MGCVIFVKLHQFEPSDRTQIRMTPIQVMSAARAGKSGATVMPLFSNSLESVRIEHWIPNAVVSLSAAFGLEALVLEGSFEENGSSLTQYSWLRLPVGSTFEATVGTAGAKVWIKAGHLRNVTRSM
jgi:hypothetical protein